MLHRLLERAVDDTCHEGGYISLTISQSAPVTLPSLPRHDFIGAIPSYSPAVELQLLSCSQLLNWLCLQLLPSQLFTFQSSEVRICEYKGLVCLHADEAERSSFEKRSKRD